MRRSGVRFLFPAPQSIKQKAQSSRLGFFVFCHVGARVVRTLYFGMVAPTPDWTLPEKQLKKCFDAGRKLMAG
jgi:hypothetical protein